MTDADFATISNEEDAAGILACAIPQLADAA
jgi:hypothetical protein